MIPDFNNLSQAFSHRSHSDLRRARLLFGMLSYPWVVRTGKVLISIANALGFPVGWIAGPLVFRHFCGGQTLEECTIAMNKLQASRIGSIPDYSAEGGTSEADFDRAASEILRVVEMSGRVKAIGFAVFKFTGIAASYGLENPDKHPDTYQKALERAEQICSAAVEAGLRVMIDAEESWLQDGIDQAVLNLMRKFNLNNPWIYTTLQMYRTDRNDYLQQLNQIAEAEGFYPGIKLVRGAYIEKERERACGAGYPSPVFGNKAETDISFLKAMKFCLLHRDRIGFCAATHNEESTLWLASEMHNQGLLPSLKGISFAQLYGMSDHISYNLAAAGFNVFKYLPYGPVKLVMPYLIRRAEENTSVAGQTGRELQLIRSEIKRRNLNRK